ncbi:MAG TPA: S8 family serine peptidase, partial [Acidobacteriota bacterium]|nr:S8 family serine peptidase [Acidobacteriota bacterium]
MRFLKYLFLICTMLGLVYPASAQYYKKGNETMVRVIIHYKGPEISPYINHDAAGIALKEGAANRIKAALQSFGGQFTYGLRYTNVISGSIPTSRLAELGNQLDVLEIIKDRIWTTADFDPFTASPEERKAWLKDKAAQIKERIANRQTFERIRSPQGMSTRDKFQAEEQQMPKKPELSLVNKAIRVQGTDSTVDASQFATLLASKGVTPNNYLFYNHGVTNAADVWNDANQGDGIIVALIDSGTYAAHPLLNGSVIGGEVAPGLAAIEADVDVNGDGVPDGRTPSATDIINNPHGTGTACMIAGHGVVTFSNSNRFLQSVKFHAPASVIDNGDGTSSILVFGSAPKAKIYAIKVFPYPGGASPGSVILAGMDRAIQLRQDFNDHKPGGIKIDVANMSLGGPDLFQGFSAEDKLADSMVAVGIQPVISAGNAGPAPFTI